MGKGLGHASGPFHRKPFNPLHAFTILLNHAWHCALLTVILMYNIKYTIKLKTQRKEEESQKIG